MPPGWAFPVAWTILYVLMGIALALILHARGARGRPLALTLFFAQLALNYSWSPVFFAKHEVRLALLVIAAMLLIAAAAAASTGSERRRAPAPSLSRLARLRGGAQLPDRQAQSGCGAGCAGRLQYRYRASLVPPRRTRMQSENRLFDDFVKVMNGAAGTLAGMTREAESAFRERMREWVGGLDMVSREEFEAVKAIAVAGREENQALKARIEKLEAAAAAPPKGAAKSGGGKKSTTSSPPGA
jgi:BMFP domain-containing protein YqiC